MYSTCIHCHRPLGANQAIEAFQVGRRLAFDADRGRLWVVCLRCREWNLTPIEERWEAVEECERQFGATRLRFSTGNIGIAKLPEGAELVRVGKPLAPEMAAWRYGAEFKKRRSVAIANAAAYQAPLYAVNILVNASLISFAVSLVGAGLGIGAVVLRLRSRWATPIVSGDGSVTRLGTKEVLTARLDTRGDSWALRWRRGNGSIWLGDAPGERALRSLMARVNAAGGRDAEIRSALELLDRVGGGERFLAAVARAWPAGHVSGLHALSPDVRLALEMALHEETERRAFDGELASLEAEWRIAEEIAAIADDLFRGRGAARISSADEGATGA